MKGEDRRSATNIDYVNKAKFSNRMKMEVEVEEEEEDIGEEGEVWEEEEEIEG